MKKEDRILSVLLIGYLVGALFVNSYVRQYRYEEWLGKDPNKSKEIDVGVCTCITTVAWPIYLCACAADKIVQTVVNTKISVEKPEIMK